jgi:hypothetical protein
MKKEELKPIIKDFLHKMCEGWFLDKPLWRTLAVSLVDANINKYDNVLDMFADENGEIDIEGILNSVGENMENAYQIDLSQFSPILPNRILLISKEDITHLLSLLNEKQI